MRFAGEIAAAALPEELPNWSGEGGGLWVFSWGAC